MIQTNFYKNINIGRHIQGSLLHVLLLKPKIKNV